MKKSKGLIAVIMTVLAVCVCAAGTLAVRQIARSSSISGETALKIACADANVPEENIRSLSSEFRRSRGVYLYNIEFETADGLYQYTVNAGTGQLLSRNIPEIPEKEPEEKEPEEKPVITATVTPSPGSSGGASEPGVIISVEKAKEIALLDAGVRSPDAVFSKAKLEEDDDNYIYEIKFFVHGTAEYEYTVDAATGEILDREEEPWEGEDDDSGTAAPEPTAEPTAAPTAEPTAAPTAEPTAEPTAAPTADPAETDVPDDDDDTDDDIDDDSDTDDDADDDDDDDTD